MYSKLRLLMFKRHITMKDLSRALNVNRNTISKKVNGKAKFTFDEILQIRNLFFSDVMLDELGMKEECWYRLALLLIEISKQIILLSQRHCIWNTLFNLKNVKMNWCKMLMKCLFLICWLLQNMAFKHCFNCG